MMNQRTVNPLLVQLLCDMNESEIPDHPTIDLLPGKYVDRILSHREQIGEEYPSNEDSLVCRNCGHQYVYDLKMVVFNPIGYKEKEENKEKKLQDLLEHLQVTGYFRCKHCNGANWELSEKQAYEYSTLCMMAKLSGDDTSPFRSGHVDMYDGSRPCWTTDAEDKILNDFLQYGSDAYVWDRLGNLYKKGGRPDLGAVAFEQAIQLDEKQLEAHYSLGNLLYEIGSWKESVFHFHQALLSGRDYRKLGPESLRDILSSALQCLMIMHQESKDKLPFLPQMSQMKEGSDDLDIREFEFDLHPDVLESFYPLAEIYMGNQRFKIPSKKRSLDKHLYKPSAYLEKKKKQRRKKKRKKKKS